MTAAVAQRAVKTELKAHEDMACICKCQKKLRGLQQVTLMCRNDTFGSFELTQMSLGSPGVFVPSCLETWLLALGTLGKAEEGR